MDFASVQIEYQPWIRTLVSSYPERYREDLTQEGLWGMYLGCCAYDPSRGVPFDAYIKVCIRNRIISASRRFAGDAHLVPLEEAETLPSVDPSPEESYVESDMAREVFRDLHARLSPLEHAVLLSYLGGDRSAQTAKRLGISAKSADNAMTRVKQKIRDLLPDFT